MSPPCTRISSQPIAAKPDRSPIPKECQARSLGAAARTAAASTAALDAAASRRMGGGACPSISATSTSPPARRASSAAYQLQQLTTWAMVSRQDQVSWPAKSSQRSGSAAAGVSAPTKYPAAAITYDPVGRSVTRTPHKSAASLRSASPAYSAVPSVTIPSSNTASAEWLYAAVAGSAPGAQAPNMTAAVCPAKVTSAASLTVTG